MSCSDYLSVKKKYIANSVKAHSSSMNTLNKQLYYIQNTTLLNEDEETMESKFFNIKLKHLPKKQKKINTNPHLQMYSIPRIHNPVYVKNRYEPPICWACPSPIGEIIYEITCSVCNTLHVVSDSLPVVSDSLLVVSDSLPVVCDSLPVVCDTLPVLSDTLESLSFMEDVNDTISNELKNKQNCTI